MRLSRVLLVAAFGLTIAAAGVGVWWTFRFRGPERDGGAPDVVLTHINTSLYDLQRTAYRNWIEDVRVTGGGLSTLADGFLLATGNGRLFFFKERPSHDGLNLQRLDITVPLNADRFEADARRILGAPAESQYFRVAGVLVIQQGERVRVLASHHHWKSEDSCFVLRVSMLDGTIDSVLGDDPRPPWRTIFETTPCLPLNTESPRGGRFGGLQAGGRMLLTGEDQLLLTVGDHDFDGWNRAPAYPQDPSSSYGKTILIRLDTGAAEVFSLGHRNSQGLALDGHGVLWGAEHGPHGGDEINIIRRGANYGWPVVTYGTEYGMHRWPGASMQGRHEGFVKPVFAFVPSRGISQLLSLRGTRFEGWKGDLLVAFLAGGRFERVRIEDDRAIFSEPIRMGRRIRDVMEAPDGRILVWTDEGEIDFLEPSERPAGELLVMKCTACHSLKAWEGSIPGPNLWRIVGRDVAAREDFEYSNAMRRIGGEWTEERLDAFLENPQATVPGTTMQMVGIRDAAERAKIVEYLKNFAR